MEVVQGEGNMKKKKKKKEINVAGAGGILSSPKSSENILQLWNKTRVLQKRFKEHKKRS